MRLIYTPHNIRYECVPAISSIPILQRTLESDIMCGRISGVRDMHIGQSHRDNKLRQVRGK